MAFLHPGSLGRGVPRAEINMIPLIDVMLVLLVIFMITAPLLTQAVKLDLPRASAARKSAVERVEIAIDGTGGHHWNGEAIAPAALPGRLTALARTRPETEIHLFVDQAARYEHVAVLLATASRAGLHRVGFVTRPVPGER
ncbi:MAG: ExbD/TolR family protein [Pseudomonadota bacterium]